MGLSYTGEIIKNENGIECAVLNTSKIDFNSAVLGRKTALTLVKNAQGGEPTGQNFKAGPEGAEYIAQAGDAIFINNENDIYVPGKQDGSRLQFANLEKEGYVNTGNSVDGTGILVKSPAAQVLVEAVEKSVCIKDAWGKDQHQFLYEGATLKLNDNGAVTGINKEAFEKTWEIA